MFLMKFCWHGSDFRQKFQTILEYAIDNPSIRIYVNRIGNKITFRVKTRYDMELLTRKLFGSTKNNITKDKNGESVPHLEITEVVLIYCNIVNNDYQQVLRVLYTFIPNK